MVSITFVDSENWTRRYQRNNKHNGLKNLRCFPYCGDLHLKNKFCGRPIEVCFQLDGSIGTGDLVFYGEFHLASEQPFLQKQLVITQAVAKLQERRKNNLKQPLYTGQVSSNMDNCIINVLFNRQEEGWHYGWLSSKHTTHLEHVFRVYVLHREGDSLRVLATEVSPSFTMFCRRRNRRESSSKPSAKKRNVVNIEKLVWTVVEGILKIEKDEQKKPKNTKVSADSKKPTEDGLTYSFNNVALNETEDTETLSDFLDMILPEISHDNVDLPTLLSHEPMTFNSTFLTKFTILPENPKKPRPAKDDILKQVALSLLADTNWADICQQHRFDSFDIRKQKMIEVLAIALSKNLAKWNYTLESFASVLDKTKKGGVQPLSSVFAENLEVDPTLLLESEPVTTLTNAQKLVILKEIERVMTGVWVNDKRTEEIFEMLREDIGYPWMLRKLVSQNSKNYSFHFENTTLEGLENQKVLLVCGFGKGLGLMSSGIKVLMNGSDCETGIFTPLPPSLKAKIIPVNKGFIDFNTKRLFWYSTYGQTNRIVTIQNFLNSERHVQILYQTRAIEDDGWVTKSCTNHKPARVQ